MFNTINIHHDQTLSVQERTHNQDRVDRLNSEMRKMVSPETLSVATRIADEFKEGIVFELYEEDNTGINFVVWSHPRDMYTTHASFRLNGREHTVSLSSLKLQGSKVDDIFRMIVEKISVELAKNVFESILKERA